MLDAGDKFDRDKFWTHVLPFEADERLRRGDNPPPFFLDTPGSAIHEHGTCRMGADPKSSVLNKFNQMHEVDNLFVVDGSAFTNASEKNPTLPSWRSRGARPTT